MSSQPPRASPPQRLPPAHGPACGPAGFGLALVAALLAAGCDGKRNQDAPAFDQAAHARRVAEERILAKAGRAGAALRAIQVYRQALATTVTVCGQINPTGRGDDAFIPFVTVVTYEDGSTAAEPRFQVVQHLADTSAAATRVYAEMVSRCFEGGGPTDARRHLVRTLPPLPNDLPRASGEAAAPETRPQPIAAATPAAPAETMPGQMASRGNVTARQHANVRTSPAGGGAVVRVVPPGSMLRVFGEAPGGWYQIGDTEPWGWVHSSMLAAP